jgi:diguanylate cyclase (GGDEF)-like protein
MSQPVDLLELNRLLDAGKVPSALALAQERLETESGAERLPTLLFIVRALGISGAPVEALRAALQARALAIACEQPLAEIEALSFAGAVHQRVDEHAKAIAYFEQAEQMFGALPGADRRSLQHGLLRRMGVSCSMLGRHELALRYIERSIALLPPDAPAQERMSSRNSVLNAQTRRIDASAQSDSEKRAAYAALLPQVASLIADAEREGCARIAELAQSNHGTLLVKAGRYKEGIACLRQAFERFSVSGMRPDQGAAMGAIGNAHFSLGQLEDAIAAYRRSLEFLDGGLISFQRDVWEGMAAAYEGLDRPREALAAYKSARALERSLKDTQAVADLEKHEMRNGMAQVTAELSKLANEDSLTGLLNRREAGRRLDAALSAGTQLSVLFIDLDRFKSINDRFGHAMGDIVLRECAMMLRQSARSTDIAARWGGEELVLILLDIRHERAIEIAERLRLAIERHEWASHRVDLRVTCSIGVASSDPATTIGADALLALADKFLYAAKDAGRNRVVAA